MSQRSNPLSFARSFPLTISLRRVIKIGEKGFVSLHTFAHFESRIVIIIGLTGSKYKLHSFSYLKITLQIDFAIEGNHVYELKLQNRSK